jgi:hypothetical protein
MSSLSIPLTLTLEKMASFQVDNKLAIISLPCLGNWQKLWYSLFPVSVYILSWWLKSSQAPRPFFLLPVSFFLRFSISVFLRAWLEWGFLECGDFPWIMAMLTYSCKWHSSNVFKSWATMDIKVLGWDIIARRQYEGVRLLSWSSRFGIHSSASSLLQGLF